MLPVLAQIDPKAAAEGLGRDFLPWALVVLGCVIAFLVRWIFALQKSKDDLQAQLLAEVKAASADKEKLLTQVMPLQTRLLEMLELTQEEG